MHADEYQPPCFKAADANMVAHFTKKPFTMDVGAVNTNHHNVGLKVSSTLTASPLMRHVHGPAEVCSCMQHATPQHHKTLECNRLSDFRGGRC